jgi:transposase
VPIINRSTGEIIEAQIFLATLGASNYTYAKATVSQDLPSWIKSHVRAFEFFGGVSEILVPDNLKSGVTNPCRYEPDINPTYQDLAQHYGAVVIPARAGKPKDKAKVESAVLVAERWILAALRNHI